MVYEREAGALPDVVMTMKWPFRLLQLAPSPQQPDSWARGLQSPMAL